MGIQKTITELGIDNDMVYRTIKKRLNDAGIEPIGNSGKSIFYDSAEANRAIWANDPKAKNDNPEFEKERTLLVMEQRRKLSRENDLAEGLVAPVETITQILSIACKQIASTLDALPLTLKKRNPNLTSRDIELVRKEIAKCRNAAAKAATDGFERSTV